MIRRIVQRQLHVYTVTVIKEHLTFIDTYSRKEQLTSGPRNARHYILK